MSRGFSQICAAASDRPLAASNNATTTNVLMVLDITTFSLSDDTPGAKRLFTDRRGPALDWGRNGAWRENRLFVA
jgi:hypothetical protein